MSQRFSVRWTLACLSLSTLMPSLDTSVANAALPALQRAFDASFRQVQWIVLAYLLAITTTVVGAGRLGDILGRKRLLLAGIASFTAASLLCGLAPSLEMLVAARIVQGVGAAVMTALAVAFVADTMPAGRTGRAMGLLGTMSAVGTTLGPSIGGLLISGPGWPAIFLVNVPVGVLALAFAYRQLPADQPRRETHTAAPLPGVRMLRDAGLVACLVDSALVSTVMMATLVVGPFYLTRALGLDAAIVGFALSVGPLTTSLSGVPAGHVVDRLGGATTTMMALAGITVAATLLTALPPAAGLVGYLASIVLMTSSYALFQAANNTVVMTGVDAGERGVVAGMLSLSRNLGLVTGASVMGAVFSVASGSVDATTAPAAVARGMRVTFAVAASLIAAAMALTHTARRFAATRVGTGAERRAGFTLARRSNY